MGKRSRGNHGTYESIRIGGAKMTTIAWQEFNRRDEIVTKEKSFKTEAAMQKFAAKLEEKDNFYRTLATSTDGGKSND